MDFVLYVRTEDVLRPGGLFLVYKYIENIAKRPERGKIFCNLQNCAK